jgi:hypothetical protein
MQVQNETHNQTRGVIQCGLAIYIKNILRQKKNDGNPNISPCKKFVILKKNSSERNQNPSRYCYNSITNLKFQHKPKTSSFKNPPIKIDLLILPRGQNPLSYYTL